MLQRGLCRFDSLSFRGPGREAVRTKLQSLVDKGGERGPTGLSGRQQGLSHEVDTVTGVPWADPGSLKCLKVAAGKKKKVMLSMGPGVQKVTVNFWYWRTRLRRRRHGAQQVLGRPLCRPGCLAASGPTRILLRGELFTFSTPAAL